MQIAAEPQVPAKKVTRRGRDVLLARWLLLTIIALNVLGMSGLWLFETFVSAHAAVNDLQVQVDSLTKSFGPEDVLSEDKLTTYAANLTAADQDIHKLDSLLPFQGALSPLPTIHHMLALAEDLIAVGQQGIAMASLLRPELQALLLSVAKPPTGTDVSAPPALTTEVLASVTQHLNQALTAWESSQAERRLVRPSDLKLIPVKSIGTYLSKLDRIAPKIKGAFSTLASLLASAPTLFGLDHPANFLLFDMDSDELRATGGYLGNYALLTLSQGLLTSGIHLHDIYTLDCPASTSSASGAGSCPVRANPPQYAWFKTDVFADGSAHFGLRDSNLDPDLPTSATLMAQMFRADGGPAVDGIILLTPNFIADLLKGIGPLSVPQFHETITAANLKDKLHYYHQNPQIGEQLGISATALGTSVFKVFDVLLSKALTAKLSGLTMKQLLALGPSLQQGLAQKDVQFYSADTTIESLLEQANIAGQVRTAPDSLLVADTNDGATYANADVKESIVDAVSLDAHLGATHSLTITYDLPSNVHGYTTSDHYSDFVRVILPATARQAQISGNCTREPTTEAGHVVLGCQMSLNVGGHIVLHASWYTPPSSSGNGHAGAPASYQFLLQRQAGSQVQTSVSIAPPQGYAIHASQPSVIVKGYATWSTAQLLTDTTLIAWLS